jgi:hypothetical protein
MPNWSDRLRQEAITIASVPILFAGIMLVAMVVMWGLLHWSYRAVLSGRDSHIAMLQRRVTEYRESLGGATPDEARRRIEMLEAETKTLRLRLQPRRLTVAQRQAIQDRSRLPAGARPYGLTIVYETDCSDCKPFAMELAATLRASEGWNVGMEVKARAPERPAGGLAITVPDPLRPPPAAVRLQEALRSAGLAFRVTGGTGDPNIQVVIAERIPE